MTSELVDKVFSKLSKELVAELLEAHKVKHSKSAKKPQLAQVLADFCREAGVQHFLECLEANTDVLKEVLANCKVETKSNSKTTLRSELKKLIKEKEEDDKGKDPIAAILKSQTKSVLKHICTAMEFESEEDDLVHDIQEEILIAGAKNVLNKLTADAVKEQVKVLKIEHVPHTKTEGVNRILALAFPALDVSEEDSKGGKKSKSAASEELKAKRKPIEECKTADELYQNYYPAELQEYCREKGMRVTGKKMELIKRILAYLAGDHTTTMKDYKQQMRKKKSEEKKRKREEKEQKDKEKKQKLDAEKAAKKSSKKEEGSKDEAKDEDNKDKMDESDDKRKKVTAKRGNNKK